jgi:hypothetical protein
MSGERFERVIDTLLSIEAAVAKSEGLPWLPPGLSISDRTHLEGRVQNAVRIYCAHLIGDVLDDIKMEIWKTAND